MSIFDPCLLRLIFSFGSERLFAKLITPPVHMDSQLVPNSAQNRKQIPSGEVLCFFLVASSNHFHPSLKYWLLICSGFSVSIVAEPEATIFRILAFNNICFQIDVYTKHQGRCLDSEKQKPKYFSVSKKLMDK